MAELEYVVNASRYAPAVLPSDPIHAAVSRAQKLFIGSSEEEMEGGGNFSRRLCYNPTSKKVEITKDGFWSYLNDDEMSVYIFQVMPAHFAMYRGFALFDGARVITEGREGKVVASVVLKHVNSGAALTIMDFKGALSFHCDSCRKKAENDTFEEDALELINALCAPNLPLPQSKSGLVAGAVTTDPAHMQNYLVDAGFVVDRVEEEDPINQQVRRAVDGWSAVDEDMTLPVDVDDSLNKRLHYDTTMGKMQFLSSAAIAQLSQVNAPSFVMSSSLAAYRFYALFEELAVQRGKQGVFQFAVQNNETDDVLVVVDNQGALEFHCSPAALHNDQFTQDVLQLLNTVFTPNMPHPYDGTIAGSVA